MNKLIIVFFGLFLSLFVLGSISFALEKVQEISVIAKQYEFIPNRIVVEKGRPVKLYATSVDVNHGFYINEFDVNQKIEKGKLSVIEFTPNMSGEYDIKCSVFCGVGHMGMKGKMIVKESTVKMDTKNIGMKKSDCGMPGM